MKLYEPQIGERVLVYRYYKIINEIMQVLTYVAVDIPILTVKVIYCDRAVLTITYSVL